MGDYSADADRPWHRRERGEISGASDVRVNNDMMTTLSFGEQPAMGQFLLTRAP